MIIPRPVHVDDEDQPVQESSDRSAAWVDWYLNVPNWKCLKCNAVMFGRMEYCVYCKFRLGVHTPRPST